MANQILTTKPTGTVTALQTNAQAIVNSSAHQSNIVLALNNGPNAGSSTNGYLYGIGTSGQMILAFQLASPGTIPTTAQIRGLQVQGDCEAGFSVTSLPIAYTWQFFLNSTTVFSSSGNIYAFSLNATVPTLTGTTATPSGGADSSGTNTLNSTLWTNLPSPAVKQVNVRGWPEWVPTSYVQYNGVLPNPQYTGADLLADVVQNNTPTPGYTASWYLGSNEIQLILGSSTSPIPAQGLNILGPLQLAIYYNQAPSAGVPTINGLSGTVAISTLTPTVNWTYSDPEGDPQAGYVVLVWPQGFDSSSQNSPPFSQWAGPYSPNGFYKGGDPLSGGASSPISSGYAPLYSSGLINTSASSFTIPSGILQPNQNYTIEILVTDNGSNTRYSPYGAGSGSTVVVNTSGANPLLGPGFSPQWNASGTTQPSFMFNQSNGGLTLQVRPRLNGFNSYDAIFQNVSGAPAVVGSVTTSGTSTATSLGLEINATGAGVSWTSPSIGVPSDSLVTGLLDISEFQAAARTYQLGLQFYDANGAIISGAAATAATATRSSYPNVSATSIATIGTVTLTGVGTSGSTPWTFIVEALKSGVSSGSSAATILNWNATLSPSNSITVSWSAVTNATGYNVWMFNASTNLWWKMITNTASTSYSAQAPSGSGSQATSPAVTNLTIPTTKAWVQTWAPVNATSAAVILTIPNSANADHYYINNLAIANDVLNLLDNGDFENGNGYWNTVLTGAATATTTNGSSTADGDNQSVLGSIVFANKHTAAADSVTLQPKSTPGLHGTKFFLSAAAQALSNIQLYAKDTAANLYPTTTANAVPGQSGWGRVTNQCDLTALSTTVPATVNIVTGIQAAIGMLTWQDATLSTNVAGNVATQGTWTAVNTGFASTTFSNGSGITMSTASGGGGTSTVLTGQYAATAGTSYTAVASGAGGLSNLFLKFYDSGHNLLTQINGTSSSGTISVTTTAPTGTAFIALGLFASMASSSSVVVSGFTLNPGTSTTLYPRTIDLDALALVPVWPLINTNMQTGTVVPYVVPLGATENTVGWFIENGSTTSGLTNGQPFNTSQHFGAETQSLAVSNGLTISQVFTVAGYTSLAVNYRYLILSAGPTAQMNISFYTAGGLLLEQTVAGQFQTNFTINGSALSAWTQTATSNIPVPSQAAYAKVSLLSGNLDVVDTVFFTDVSITPTGTLTMPSYTSGGFSEGTKNVQPAIVLERSVDGGNTWKTVRYNGGSLSQSAQTSAVVATARSGFTAPTTFTYVDYEWSPIAPDVTEQTSTQPLYNAYISLLANGYQNLGPASPSRAFFRIPLNDWWLIDPAVPGDSILLNLKTIKLSTTENMAKFNGLGRKRVIVIGDVVQGDAISVELLSFTSSQYTTYQNQINKQSALLLRSPDGEQWYVRPTKRDRVRTWTGTYSRPLRSYSLDLQEIDPLI